MNSSQTRAQTVSPALQQLACQLRKTARDSENQPITEAEIAPAIERLIQQLVLNYRYLDEAIQETLDDLRFRETVA